MQESCDYFASRAPTLTNYGELPAATDKMHDFQPIALV